MEERVKTNSAIRFGFGPVLAALAVLAWLLPAFAQVGTQTGNQVGTGDSNGAGNLSNVVELIIE